MIHQPGFEEVQGMVIGRFQKESNIEQGNLVEIIKTKRELDRIPVIAKADFGHTTPQFTFPIGGQGELNVSNGKVEFAVIRH